jgi:hypothetical protein
VPLPEGVHKVISKGRTYYYWSPNRGTGRECERVRLPNADANPIAFARQIEMLRKAAEPVPDDGTVAHLTRRYRDSEDFKSLSESTRTSYSLHLDRLIASGARCHSSLMTVPCLPSVTASRALQEWRTNSCRLAGRYGSGAHLSA